MEEVLSKIKRIYLIGIGGIGMSGLASLLHDKGYQVRGSDIKESATLERLRLKGIEVILGQKETNIGLDIELVVYSSAIKEENPEIREAKRKAIPLLRRGEILSFICRGEKVVAVSGSHGKTTTASLISYLLTSLGKQPTTFVGGLPLNYYHHAWWGEGYFVVETDESDGSFLLLKPSWSIITNIDFEHIDYYKTIGNLSRSFLQFASQTKEEIFAWGDSPLTQDILSSVKGVSFGLKEGNRVRAKNITFGAQSSFFDLFIDGKLQRKVETSLMGKHNVLNVLAALSFLHFTGENVDEAIGYLKYFKGTKRRFQLKERTCGITFVDDYAHHPTEIRAVLQSARLLDPQRLVVIFQPHRFSRVKLLLDEFSSCFSLADTLIMTDIYTAGETTVAGVNETALFDAIQKKFPKDLHYFSKNDLPKELPALLKEGDFVLCLGAGDINIVCDEVVHEVKRYATQARR